MTSAVGFLGRVRRVLAGDSFDGLRTVEEMRDTAEAMKTELLVPRRRADRAVLAEIAADQEAKWAAHYKRIEDESRKAWEDGRRSEVDADPEKSPELLAFLDKWAGKVRSLGCPVTKDASGNAIEPHVQHITSHYGARVAVITDELAARFQRDGEPAEVLELRKRINEAKLAEWPARKTLKEAKDKLHALGLALVEAEVVEAARVLAVAEAKTGALVRELAEWGLQ